MMLDDVEECQLSGPIGELVPFTSSAPSRGSPHGVSPACPSHFTPTR
jgi:hypothetical protein